MGLQVDHHDQDVKRMSQDSHIEDRTVEQLEQLAATYEPGSEAEKKFLRKIDMRIMPCIWALYTLSYLDRANIGNAKTGGMEDDLNLTSEQYSIVLLVFFISYVLFEIPSNLILARVRPGIYLSLLCVLWGGVSASMAACQNWQQLAGVRFALGIAEAGFSPGVTFYLSSWYRRYELSTRFSIYYTATAVSGAFSGLLAGVITQHLDGARGIAGWRWLLLIEGVGSSFLGCFTWLILPDWPSKTKLLTEEERLLAAQRLAYDGLGATQGADEEVSELRAVKMVFTDWRVLYFIVMYMLATGTQTIQYFIPTLVSNLGYKGYDAQFHTIPVYASAFVFILAFCFLSDRAKNKPLFIMTAGAIGTLCFIITVAQTNQMVQYVFLIFGFGSVYAACPLVLTWVPNIISHPAKKRAVAIALVNGLGNSASIYGVFLWPKSDAPRYIPGWSATTIWMALLAVMAMVFPFFLRRWPEKDQKPEFAQHEQRTQLATV